MTVSDDRYYMQLHVGSFSFCLRLDRMGLLLLVSEPSVPQFADYHFYKNLKDLDEELKMRSGMESMSDKVHYVDHGL